MVRVPSEKTLAVLRPLFLAAGAVFKALDTALLGWLHWWMQKRGNHRLAEDVLASLYFLSPEAVRVKERTRVLPFGYVEVKVLYGNLCFTFTRGRGEVNVSLSPRHDMSDSHLLENVIPAIESRHVTYPDATGTLLDAVSLIRPRVQALNEAFSPQRYPEFKEKL